MCGLHQGINLKSVCQDSFALYPRSIVLTTACYTGSEPIRYGPYVVFKDILRATEHEKRRWRDGAVFGFDVEALLEPDLWIPLQSAVWQFASGALPREVSLDVVDEATAAKAREISPKADKLLAGNSAYAALFFASWIWHILCDHVFACDDKWRSGPWEHFAEIQRAIKGTYTPPPMLLLFLCFIHGMDADYIVKGRVTNEPVSFNDAFYSARAYTARLLYTLHGEHSDPTRLRNIILGELQPFIDLRKDPWPDAGRMFDYIISLALRLDLLMESSHYVIRVSMRDPVTQKRWGFPLDADQNIMRHNGRYLWPYENPRDILVDIVYEPSIQLNGLFDGSRYGDERLVVHRDYCSWSTPLVVD
jgi:hypothetical protein